MDQTAQQFTTRVAVIGGYAVQLVAMMLAAIYVIVRDGSATAEVINALIVVALGNAGAGAIAAVAGHLANASVAKAQVQATAAVAASQPPPTAEPSVG